MFTWRDTYGRVRRVVGSATAGSERAAVAVARENIKEIYGITGARVLSAEVQSS